MLNHTLLKQHNNTVASLDVLLQAKNKQNSSTSPEILTVCYFGERLACPGMPYQTQQMLHDLTKPFTDN